MIKILGHKKLLIALLFVAIFLIVWLYFFESLWLSVWFGLNYINVNKLIERLALGYISSYMFYYIVVIIKTKEDKKIILPVIAEYTYKLLNNVVLFSSEFRSWGGLEKIQYETNIHNRNPNIYPTKDEIIKACSNIKPNQDTRTSTGIKDLSINPTFFELMKNYSYNVDHCLNVLLQKSNHLDLNLLKLITNLKVSRYHDEMISKLMFRSRLPEDALHTFSKGFDEYYQMVREIEKFADKELKSYVEHTGLKTKR